MVQVVTDTAVREEAGQYVLPLRGRAVDQVCIDYSVTFVIEGTDTIRLDTPFTVCLGEQTLVVDPARMETVAPVLGLFQAVVTRAIVGKDGSLSIDFDEERWLRSDPDADAEAWEIGGGLPPVTPSYQLCALPGGAGVRFD